MTMWPSYRKFVVDRIVQESRWVKSFYLIPSDGKPIAPFLPGQHLPLRLSIPGQAQAIFRFYTLSDCDNSAHYRLTIQKELSPVDQPGSPAGLVSAYFHDVIQVGDIIEAKAPAGDFFLDLDRNHPVVFIAGGIGITPLLCMLNAVVRHQPDRPVWFFYAVRNGDAHVFKDHLREVSARHPNIRFCVLYSQPTAAEPLGVDYHLHGRLDVARLTSILPTLDMEYYACGPESMMKSVVSGLLTAGVMREQIKTESFGPSSAAFTKEPQIQPTTKTDSNVTFQKSDKTFEWNSKARSLWEFAEQNGIEISSGCLYGDCGTCATRLVEGQVTYNHPTTAVPDPGYCLPCSCKPDGAIVIDA